MAEKNNNKVTLEDLAAMTQRGFADVEQRLGGRMDTGFQVLAQTMKDMLEEMSSMHGDVRYIRSTMNALTHSDIAQEAIIIDLKARVHRLEQKAGLVKILSPTL